MPYPHNATTQDMIPFMATKGADLLVKGLKHRVFESTEPITHSEASILEITDGKGIAHAPKITPKDRHISSWGKMDAATLLRKDRALGNLWDTTTFKRWTEELGAEFGASFSPSKRVIFSGGFSVYEIGSIERAVDSSDGSDAISHRLDPVAQVNDDIVHVQSILNKSPQPGQLVFLPRGKTCLPSLLILTSDRKFLRVNSCTIEGGKKDNGIKELWAQHNVASWRKARLSSNHSWKEEREDNPKIIFKYQKLRHS